LRLFIRSVLQTILLQIRVKVSMMNSCRVIFRPLMTTKGSPVMVSSRKESVVSSSNGGVGWITLNRPKALNALNLDMIRTLTPLLRKWESGGEAVKLVVIKGEGGKAFCAGGDIRAITEVPGGDMQKQFFKEEYQLDYLVGRLAIPYVAVLNGITMGGGVGISVNGMFRVATEKTVFAMPETSIGLVPDVGGGHFLPRMTGQLGMFLGLTGHRLKGWDCLHAGVATHAVKEDMLKDMEAALASLGENEKVVCKEQVKQVLDQFDSEEAKEHTFTLAKHMQEINRVFSGDTVEQIMESLKSEESELASKALKSMNAASPTSLKVAHRQIRQGEKMTTLGDVLKMEYRLVTRCCQDKDFYEGVRAALIDRDNKPVWVPGVVEDVTMDRVELYFSNLGETEELSLE